MQYIMIVENYNMQEYNSYILYISCHSHPQWIAPWKTLVWIPEHSQFLLYKETTSCRQNVVTFWHNIASMVNRFVVLLDFTIYYYILDITAMINILQEIIKTLQ